MSAARLMHASERWFRLLERLYPPDFRDDMGDALVEAYRDRAREALERGGVARLAGVWVRALVDALQNGPGERLRPAAAWRRTGNWGRDIERVTRRLLRAPAFVIATVATLALGLAMFAVVVTVVQKILIERPAYPNADDLYYVWRDYGSLLDLRRGAVAGPDIVELQKRTDVIEGVAALQRCWCGIFALREGSEPIEIAVTVASPNLFEVLGVEPALGRGFAPDEVGPGRPGVIVLTHELWNGLGADPAIVGTDVRLNGRPYTVVGVLPPTFAFVRHEPLGPPQPIAAYTTHEVRLADMSPEAPVYSAVIRARAGTSPSEVTAAVDAAGRAVDARDFHGRGLRLYPVQLHADLVSAVRPAILVLGAAGVVFWLMLMANLSSVLLARSAERQHELAISRALGANGVAIIRATLLEGAVLGLLGGALGALAAIWGTRALVALAPVQLPRREALAVDFQIAAVVTVLGAALGLLAAAAPALWTARASLPSLLGGSAVRGGPRHGRIRRGLVVAQVALSLVLLTSVGLVARSFERLLRADPGFTPEGLLTVLVRTPPEFFPEFTDAVAFHERVQSALAALPGVTGASAVTTLPLTAAALQATVVVPGAPGTTGDPRRDAVLVDVIAARPRYVEVMGMRLAAGRTFGASRPAGVLEALIDRSLATRLFPIGSPLGAEIPFGDRRLTIIGVIDQARLYDLHQDGRPQVFIRSEDAGVRPHFFVVRTPADPLSLLPDVRTAIRRIDSRVAVGNARTMDEIVSERLGQQRTSAALVTAFAGGALLLAAMGLFGVVAGSVTRRRHELAVRLALGAGTGRVQRLVLGEGALLVAAGVVCGIPGIYVAGRLIRGVLVGVTPSDPVTIGAVVGSLVAVTMVTCYVPARRTLRIEPAQLLRQE